jgi:hypothetical protein
MNNTLSNEEKDIAININKEMRGAIKSLYPEIAEFLLSDDARIDNAELMQLKYKIRNNIKSMETYAITTFYDCKKMEEKLHTD